MLKNYFMIALRSIKKNFGYSLINLSGLAVGLACCILIFLWVQDELSYDRFQENKDQLYRLILQDFDEGGDVGGETIPFALAPLLKEKFPEIVDFCRFQNRRWMADTMFSYGEKKYYEYKFFLAEPSFFQMFTFPFLRGNPQTALRDQFSIVITEEMATKYFGREDPMGKILKYNNRIDLKVTGVMKNLPRNSHMDFDFIAPIQLLGEKKLSGWQWESNSYVMLAPHIRLDQFRNKIERTFVDNTPHKWIKKKVNVQPITKIHLYQGKGDIKLVYIFSLIALFILLIACMNYMNLATARSVRRAREVGLRKVVGAQKNQLVKQFLSETLVLALIAILLALVLVQANLGAFNSLTQKKLSLDIFNNPILILGLLGLILLVGFFSGSYPALVLSAFKPVSVLKGNILSGSRGTLFRKIMVIGQFAISITLIICTLIIHQQLHYIQNKELGWDRENIIVIPINSDLEDQFQSFKQELLQNPRILNVTAASTTPASIDNTSPISWEGMIDKEPSSIKFVVTEYGYLDTFDMKLVKGRNFSPEHKTDLSNFIVNEEAVKLMKLENPVGKGVEFMGAKGQIIGVMKNFHFKHMSSPILPLVLTIHPALSYFYRSIFVKIRPENIQETINYIEKVSSKYNPHFPFTYRFEDEEFNKLYISENYVARIVNYFTILALFIACLGLFGLASFMTEQRTKEIGVRKVLGASVNNIVFLLIKEFSKWVVIAGLVACPVAYYFMNKWLSNYVFRIPLQWWPFVLAGLLGLFIAGLTVSYQAIRASLTNPVNSLRSE